MPLLPAWLALSTASAQPLPPPFGATTENRDLRDQLAEDEQRVLPQSDVAVLAVDSWTFLRGPSPPSDDPAVSAGLYHSGAWFDIFTEVDPFEGLRANLRLSIVNPGTSYGIVSQTSVVAWPALTWSAQRGEWRGQMRFFDQPRQTIGAGLVVQEQEVSGTSAQMQWKALRARYWWMGTGTFNMYGDLRGGAIDLWEDGLGAWMSKFMDPPPYSDAPPLKAIGLYSAREWPSGLRPLAELSMYQHRFAGMLGLAYARDKGGRLGGGLKVQSRAYQDGYAEGIAGQIGHDYLAPEQEMLDFVRADNIFVYDDGVILAAGRGWLLLRPIHRLHLRMDHELVRLWPEANSALSPFTWWWLWRGEAAICLRAPDNLCMGLVFSNRTSAAEDTPLDSGEWYNRPMLKDQPFYGIETRLRF